MTWICVGGHAHGTPMLVKQHEALGADFAGVMRDHDWDNPDWEVIWDAIDDLKRGLSPNYVPRRRP